MRNKTASRKFFKKGDFEFEFYLTARVYKNDYLKSKLDGAPNIALFNLIKSSMR